MVDIDNTPNFWSHVVPQDELDHYEKLGLVVSALRASLPKPEYADVAVITYEDLYRFVFPDAFVLDRVPVLPDNKVDLKERIEAKLQNPGNSSDSHRPKPALPPPAKGVNTSGQARRGL